MDYQGFKKKIEKYDDLYQHDYCDKNEYEYLKNHQYINDGKKKDFEDYCVNAYIDFYVSKAYLYI